MSNPLLGAPETLPTILFSLLGMYFLALAEVRWRDVRRRVYIVLMILCFFAAAISLAWAMTAPG
jgi:hypothetical protein